MVINIASFGGRTHLLDTARELAKQGNIVRFYSYVPTKRAVKYGLPAECNYSLFLWALPFLVLYKIFGFKNWNQYLYHRIFDVFTAYYMKPCDVFIGQSPMHNFSIRYAKKKYNALTILERGSAHILEYKKQLDGNPKYHGKPFLPNFMIKHDYAGYLFPDYISVGCDYAKKSFLQNGYFRDNIFVNNYGFDTSQFTSTCLSEDAYDLIYVGRWSYLKGCDLLTEACRKKNYKLLHVGSIFDMDFPKMKNLTHIDAVEQLKLKYFYSHAKVFVLPSRTEGFGMVLCQAAACGLPIVCSKNTGGPDLKKYTISKEWIITMDNYTVDSLIQCIETALQLSKTQKGFRSYLKASFIEASWDGYGRRYNEFLKSIIRNDK